MKLSKARAKRGVRFTGVDFSATRDHRDRWSVYEHQGLLRLLVAAIATGASVLRQVESFADTLPQKALRGLGLVRAPSDTSLYRLLAEQTAVGFALVVVQQVKEALLCRWIDNDLFPRGVAAIQRKPLARGTRSPPCSPF